MDRRWSFTFTDRPSVTDQTAEIWTMRYLGTDRHKISTSVNFDYRPTWGVRDPLPDTLNQ